MQTSSPNTSLPEGFSTEEPQPQSQPNPSQRKSSTQTPRSLLFDQTKSHARSKEHSKSVLHMAVKDMQVQNARGPTATTLQNTDNPHVFIKYNVAWVSKAENNKVYKILIELAEAETVTEAIRDIIPFLNEKLAQENSAYTLSTDPNYFDLYKAKKTGFPKLDYPSLDSNQNLNQTCIRQLNLSEKSPEGVIAKNSNPYTMVQPSMPEGKFINESEWPEEARTTTTMFCWCIPIKKEKKMKRDLQRKESELEARLIPK